MKIVGLVGGSGAGKGTVASLFAKYNFASIDTDLVYRELTSHPSPCLSALREEFGDSVVKNEALDRAYLASLVFADGNRDKLEKLNRLTHKYILDEVRRRIPVLQSEGYSAVLIDAPLLFESGFDRECDIILCVVAEKNVRVSRIVERDALTYERASARIEAQMSEKELTDRSDFVIRNDTDLDTLEKEVERLAFVILNN